MRRLGGPPQGFISSGHHCLTLRRASSDALPPTAKLLAGRIYNSFGPTPGLITLDFNFNDGDHLGLS